MVDGCEDGANSTLSKVSLETGVKTTIAGSAWDEGFSDGNNSAALFTLPAHACIVAGKLYITDWARIRVVE